MTDPVPGSVVFDPDDVIVQPHEEDVFAIGELLGKYGGGDYPELDGEDQQPACCPIGLSPTCWKFVQSDVHVPLIFGARGEGKSTSGVVRLIRIASEHPEFWPLKVAVVRDTWKNLSRTTFATLTDGMQRGWWTIEFSEARTEATLNDGMVRLYFFGMDNAKDANKFQSFECHVVWLEEPAPAADLASGIPIEVFSMAVSSMRSPGFKNSVQITMNPPDEDHWVLELTENLVSAGHPEMSSEVFHIITGENQHLPEGYRMRMRLGLEAALRPDMVKRLVEGNIGTVIVGEPVTPEFSDLHVVKDLSILRGVPLIRGWDFALNPACVYVQVTPLGHMNVLGCLQGVNIGLEELISQQVKPWERRMGIRIRSTRGPGYGSGDPETLVMPVRDIGDPSGSTRDQSSSERSARRTLEEMLKTNFEKGPVAWPARRDSTKAVLTRMFGGRPMVQIDKDECAPLIHGLRGRWRYLKSPSGKITALPLKDMASHSCDAWAYVCAVLFPVADTLVPHRRVVPPGPRARPPESVWGV